ncbi:MAG: PilW family protein [Desulfomonilia bacterium]|jgi:prepilin-type N-terminal cleavage/methylation domain-containing protein|uniref:Prepilin-type N-terminal cleavage/methylation domain-containing protein n=1 Tax=anaerobic digester metagenome TaxID=1263854 RepID=A0A485MCA3_9ZZZZ|nr:prepilin-type N-terminal cleavage/methylation domain-containing protein [Deltaproteobacteria bacterium]HRS56441.1 prepilin-type N-terminal cleavage/methylation domain-containing protein [Desulfomonilia bacterium]HRV36241.1 prepilin-type N-terminal cleavage/methylation domain-containing protein [Desulfomonilia bacterium]
MMSICRFFQDNRGLTLIELMIVLALSLVLMGAVYLAFHAQQVSGNEQQQVASVQQDLRAVMLAIEKDLRNAGCDPLFVNTPTNMIFGIQTPLANDSLTVSYDLDADGTLDTGEQITYALVDGVLQRTSGPATITLADNIEQLEFTYLDIDGVSTNNLSDIRSIEVRVAMKGMNGKVERTLNRRIKCRNMGL